LIKTYWIKIKKMKWMKRSKKEIKIGKKDNKKRIRDKG
jgi:hypothetical protein